MIGYWSPNCPVKTSHDKVLATVYKRNGAAMVSIGSWAKEDVDISLHIDWQKLGIDPANAVISAPEINHFQPARTFRIDEPIPVAKNKGWLLVIHYK